MLTWFLPDAIQLRQICSNSAFKAYLFSSPGVRLTNPLHNFDCTIVFSLEFLFHFATDVHKFLTLGFQFVIKSPISRDFLQLSAKVSGFDLWTSLKAIDSPFETLKF